MSDDKRADTSSRERKQAKRQFKEQGRLERVQLLERAGLSLETLEVLLKTLDDRLAAKACDHTHRHLEALLGARGLDVDAAREALIAEGAGCDCEAIMNIELEELWPPPPPPAAAPPPAPEGAQRKQPKGKPPERWTRGRFSLSIPKSPWKLEEAADTLVLRFGAKSGFGAVRVRIGDAGPGTEAQICRDRWVSDSLRSMTLVSPDEPADALRRKADAEWDSYAIQLTGPTPWKSAALEGREYVARGKNYAYVFYWVFFGGPDDRLLVELGPSDSRRATGDRRELDKVLATLGAG